MGEPKLAYTQEELPTLKKNYPVFRFLGGNLISFFGDQVYLIAIPLMVLSITQSAFLMGVVAALERLPILFQPLTGVLADRFNRKKLLILCDIGRSLLVGAMGVMFLMEHLEMWHIFSGALLIGLLSQIYNTSQIASIPSLVRQRDLQMVNSLNTGFLNTAILVAPGLGGILISIFNPGYALLLNSFSFFIAFLVVASLPVRTPKPLRPKGIKEEIIEGFQFVRNTKPILFTNLAMLLSVFGTTLFLTMMIYHLKETIGLTAVSIGLLLSLGGLGAIIGSLSSTMLRRNHSYRTILFIGSLVGGMSIVLFSYTQSYLLLILLNAIGTIAASIQSPCIVTIRQTLTPAHLLGRVQATSRFMTWALMPVAAFLSGIMAEQIGSSLTIFIGGLCVVLASFIYLHPSLVADSTNKNLTG